MTALSVDHTTFEQFRSAWLRMWTADGVIEVRPTPDTDTAVGIGVGPRPPLGTVHFVTAWNAGGLAAEPEFNDRNHHRMLANLTSHGIAFVPAAILAPDAQWAQPAAALIDVTHNEAMDRARCLGQAVLISRTETQLTTTGVDGTLSSSVGWHSAQLGALPCPVHPPDQHRRHLCKSRGGPWGHAAITAASEWAIRRSSLLRALGCDVCGGGLPDSRHGSPIVLVATQDPAPAETSVWVEPRRYLNTPTRPW